MNLFQTGFSRSRAGERALRGVALAPGIGEGKGTHLDGHPQEEAVVKQIPRARVERERMRIDRAIAAVRDELTAMSEEIEERFDVHTAGIFLAQIAMLDDPSLRDRLSQEVAALLVNAEEVVRRVFTSMESRLRESASDSVAARADDVADLRRRVLLRLGGVRAPTRLHSPAGSVILAEHIYPSDTAALPRNGVEALVVSHGSPGSHVALLAKEMGIPVVSGIADVRTTVPEGTRIIVDGNTGLVLLSPSERTSRKYRRRIARGNQVRVRERWLRRRPVVTPDGTRVDVHANVGDAEDARLARQFGAAGIGLFRLEQLYLTAAKLPTEDELVATLLEAAKQFRGKPVNVRLLDVGGDKRLPYLDVPREENPFLGRRGVRLLFHFPELLRTELRALLRVHATVPIRITVPMVTFADDLVRVRAVMAEVAAELGADEPDELPPLGSMIETPAAALAVEEIAGACDFLSIGTNDLTQYTMAADRDNPLVSEYFRTRHPALLSLVRNVVENASGRPVCVCGDVAGDLDALPQLLEIGVTCLSVAPPLIAQVKDRLRNLSTNG